MSTWRVVTAASTVLLLVGCVGPQDSAACRPVPPGLVQQLEGHLVDPGELRNAVAVPSADGQRFFVSVEKRTPRQVERDIEGEILTLTTPRLDGGALAAVDERARKQTDLPPADVTMREDGAVESRGCVAVRRTSSESS